MPLWQGQLLGVICALAGILLRVALTPLLGHGFPFVTFFPAILIASLVGGPAAGLTCVVVASPVAAYLWLEPQMGLAIEAPSWLRIVVFWALSGLLITTLALLRALVRALVESEERALILAHEMTHRARNVLGLIQAISRQTFQSAATLADYQTLFEARLVALGRAQELVIENPNLPTDLKTLLDRVLEPFDTERFSFVGAPAGVPHEIGATLALLIHELGTNSLKYGALSAPEGHISVTWAADANRIKLDWDERNGPPVAPPARNGFGTRLMQTAFPPGRGEAAIVFEPNGVRCQIYFPAAG
jgi:two-component sensor histidine kinase